jgi:O-antigen/teichoic acid export membrane protein
VTDAAAKSTLTRNTLWSLASYALQFIVPILLIPYIVSRVTKEVYGGVWVTLYTLTSWLSYFDLGLWGGLTREVAERHARKDRDGLKALWATWLTFDLALGALLMLATWIGGTEILRRYVPLADPVSDRPVLLGLAAQFVLSPGLRHLTCTLTGLQRLDLSSRLALVITPLWTAGQVLALEGGWGLRGLMLNGLAFTVIQILALLVILAKQDYPMTLSPARFSSRELRQLLGFGWKLQAGNVLNQAFRNDRLVMSAMQSSGAAIAFYQFGAGVMDRLAGAVAVLSSGILSAVSDLAARGDRDRVRVVFLRGTKYHALAGFGLLGFAALFGHELMMFWMGESLPDSVRVLRIMALGGLATAIGSCGQSVAVALGRPGWTALCSAMGLSATVFLYMTVGRRYDTVGLAASVSLGLALIQVAFMIGLRGFLEFRWGEYVGNALLKPAVLAVPLAGVYAGWSALAPHLPAVDSRFRAFLVLAPAFLLSAALGWAMARAFRVVDEYDLDVLKSPGRRASA